MSAAFFTRSSNRTEKTVPLTQMAGAYHAAGHAVANIVQGLDLHPVTVPVDGQHNGVVVDHERVAELRPTHELHADTFTLHRQALLEKRCALISRDGSPSAALARARGAAITIRVTSNARSSCCFALQAIPNAQRPRGCGCCRFRSKISSSDHGRRSRRSPMRSRPIRFCHRQRREHSAGRRSNLEVADCLAPPQFH
jgi:hypothetical protein